jgi:hypothetical protein
MQDTHTLATVRQFMKQHHFVVATRRPVRIGNLSEDDGLVPAALGETFYSDSVDVSELDQPGKILL